MQIAAESNRRCNSLGLQNLAVKSLVYGILWCGPAFVFVRKREMGAFPVYYGIGRHNDSNGLSNHQSCNFRLIQHGSSRKSPELREAAVKNRECAQGKLATTLLHLENCGGKILYVFGSLGEYLADDCNSDPRRALSV